MHHIPPSPPWPWRWPHLHELALHKEQSLRCAATALCGPRQPPQLLLQQWGHPQLRQLLAYLAHQAAQQPPPVQCVYYCPCPPPATR